MLTRPDPLRRFVRRLGSPAPAYIAISRTFRKKKHDSSGQRKRIFLSLQRRTTLWHHQQKELESSHWRQDSSWPAAQSVHCSSSSCFSWKGPLASTTAPGTTLSARSVWARGDGCK